MTRRALILATLLALAIPASAGAYPFLSEHQAEHDAQTVALRSAHRIWRVSDTTIESMSCGRAASWIFVCDVTVGLHYTTSECVPPVEVEARFSIGKVSRTAYLWEQRQPWEVQPVSTTPLCGPEGEPWATEAENRKRVAEVEGH